jgi:hypothetical protein
MIELQWASKSLPATQSFDGNGNPGNTALMPFPTGYPNPQFPLPFPMVNGKCRLQVRGWKNFPVLNGRWTAQVVAPFPGSNNVNPYTPSNNPCLWALRILRKVRQPMDNSVPFVNPISWSLWWPGQQLATSPPLAQGNPLPNTGGTYPTPSGVQPPGFTNWNDFFQTMFQYQYVESKKLGKLWGSERGRQRNRPQ